MTMPDQHGASSSGRPISIPVPRLTPAPGVSDAVATADATKTAAPMLTAGQVGRGLGVTAHDLAGLAAAGLLRAYGPAAPAARCYPIIPIEATERRLRKDGRP